MADDDPSTSVEKALTTSKRASNEAPGLSGVQASPTLEDLKSLVGHKLNLNPRLRIEKLKLPMPSTELEEEEEEEEGNNDGDNDDSTGDDDDDEEELSEELKQQMQQLTSIVNNAFKRADIQRNVGSLNTEIPDGSSTLGEVEFSSRKHIHHDLSRRSSVAGTRPGSPYMPLPSSACLSSFESHSTHTSDFHPAGTAEDGEKLLETLNNTPDSLEKALTLNQVLQRRLSINIERLEVALKQNLHRQLILHAEEDEERLSAEEERNLRSSDSRYFLRITSFSRPYFKTKIGMPAPMNEDAKYKIEHGYLDMYQTHSRPWSRKDDKKLQLAVRADAKQERVRLLEQKENSIKRSMKNIVVKEIDDDKEIAHLASEAVQCQQAIQSLKATPVSSVSVPSDIQLDWIKIAAQAFDGHRTPHECEHRWYALLSTEISQKNFSEKDDIAIQAAVRSYGRLKPDWEAIAAQLSEPRSAFQVFRRYRTFISRALNPVKWDSAASKLLVQLVEHLRVGEYIPWNQIHQRMPQFTRTQLQGQWKKLNPDRRKGPFTRHEDSIFLRGLLKFGLNFQQILQFMPQRNKDQLKDRFRRILVAVFMSEWTREMDDELRSLSKTVEPCHLNTSFWRRLAAVPGFANTGKDATMLRMRYLILQLWREITLSDETPPPLFPVTITTAPEEIALLNKHFLKAEVVELRMMIDQINAGNHIREALLELETRRLRLHQQYDQHTTLTPPAEKPFVPLKLNHIHLHHIQQRGTKCCGDEKGPALDGRSIAVRSPAALSWPEQLILEFFLPSKPLHARPAQLSTDSSAVSSLQLLMKVLQLRPMPPESCDSMTLEDLNISQTEAGLVHYSLNQHTCKMGHLGTVSTENDLPCAWCSGDAVPEALPLLPPSAATVGALLNLLIHKKALRTMASKSFVLHRFKGPDLYRLKDKSHPGRSLSDPSKDYIEGRLPIPGRVGKIHITSGMPWLGLREKWLQPRGLTRRGKNLGHGGRKKVWKKRSIVDIYKSFKSGKNLSKYQGPKQAEAGVQSATTAQTASSLGDAHSETHHPPELNESAAFPTTKKARIEVKKGKRNPPLLKPLPETWEKYFAPQEPPEEAVAESSDSEDETAMLTTEEFRARTDADNLLWHRFLAIFLWPALLSCVRPLAVQEEQVEQQHETMCEENAKDSKDNSQSISGVASSILQEVAQVERRKRKRSSSRDEGGKSTEASEGGTARKKESPAPTRTSARLKTRQEK